MNLHLIWNTQVTIITEMTQQTDGVLLVIYIICDLFCYGSICYYCILFASIQGSGSQPCPQYGWIRISISTNKIMCRLKWFLIDFTQSSDCIKPSPLMKSEDIFKKYCCKKFQK